MAHDFFLAIGYWNLGGSIVLYLMLNPMIANTILKQWIWIITQPYDVGTYGSLWLLWAATTNTFLGLINLWAANWQPAIQRLVLYGDVFVYGVIGMATIAVLRHTDYGQGTYFNVGLGIFWLIWAALVLNHIEAPFAAPFVALSS